MSSLLPNGTPNTSALNVELDIPQAPFHAPAGQAFVKIWGISIAEIGSSYDLNGADIEVYGGMSPGLPLATAQASQAGLLVKGQILQAFGSWLGTDQSIDLIITAGGGTRAAPQNFAFSWPAGTPLSTALAGALRTGLPGVKQQINLSPRLVLNYDVHGVYGTLIELSTWINEFSKTVVTDANYPGVTIVYNGASVNVTDQTAAPPKVIPIAFQDQLGQPSWIAPGTIQVKTVMRSDIQVSSLVSLPKGLVQTTGAALTRFSSPNNSSTFTGTYYVSSVHHYGNFRQPDGNSWNSTFNMTPQGL